MSSHSDGNTSPGELPINEELVDSPSAVSDMEADRVQFGPTLPRVYIRISPHPNSGRPDQIISLDGDAEHRTEAPAPAQSDLPSHAPFRSLADFLFAEVAVKLRWSNSEVDDILGRLHGPWTAPNQSNVSFRHHRDLEASLAAARKFVVPFRTGTVAAEYKGQMREFTFPYRDPWEWIVMLLQDPTLALELHLFSCRKYFCDTENDIEERLIDEPWTADAWASVDDEFTPLMQTSPLLPHCYAPVLVWLDKTGVSESVKLHPILARALFLPEIIRNASGNGGGILLGWMPIIEDPDDPENTGAGDDNFGIFKRTVYQLVLGHIFEPLRRKSRDGFAMHISDGTQRIMFPGILIASLDAEEAAVFCACKAHNANVPCPKCLVTKDELSNITGTWTPRTSATMQAAWTKASQAQFAYERDQILKDNGLHLVKHFLWEYDHSDPYHAYSYDTLHSDDGGKWGRHLWLLVKKVVEEAGWSSRVSANMAQFPRWRNLRHFRKVMKVEFADGEKHLHVLKCIIPTLAQILPPRVGAPLIHCIRAYIKFRMLVGCHCMSETRIVALRSFIQAYETCCREVTRKLEKDFNFIKQHQVAHVVDDILQKGVTSNYVTRPSEGFQQEVKQMYARTNYHGPEAQMSRQDENGEAIALIRMTIDSASNDHQSDNAADSDNDEDPPATGESLWRLGASKRKWVHITQFAAAHGASYASFELDLRAFLIASFPVYANRCSGSIKLQEYGCLRIHYQSQDDYRLGLDILRCTQQWHNEQRRDCVLYDDPNSDFAFARLRHILRCKLMDSATVDIAVVHRFRRPSPTWAPRIKWDGCMVLEESTEFTFLPMHDVIRGALLCPAFDGPRASLHYVVDTIDEDMFLRLNQL